MIKLLQSNWACALLGALFYLGTTVTVWKTPKLTPPAEALTETVANATKPSWEFQNPEVEQLIADLKRQREDLTAREKQAKDLEQRVQLERQELTVLTQVVARLEIDFDKNVVRVNEEETANLKHLAKIYATMAPESAASVFKEMKDDDIVKILTFMKDSETSQILELLANPKRTAQITDRLRIVVARNNVADKAKP